MEDPIPDPGFKAPAQLLTIDEVASMCQCSRATVQRAVRAGTLPAMQFSRRMTRFHPSDVAQYQGKVRAKTAASRKRRAR